MTKVICDSDTFMNQFEGYKKTSFLIFILITWLETLTVGQAFQNNFVSPQFICKQKQSDSYTNGIAASKSDSTNSQTSRRSFNWDKLLGRFSLPKKDENKTPMRAWMCHGRTHKEMVERLMSAGIITTEVVRDCLLQVDRANYVPDEFTSSAYQDAPLSIGYGATISAPHMHAHVLEEIVPVLFKAGTQQNDKDLKILDVGCGSGYLTAALGRLVDQRGPIEPLRKGRVYGIDIIKQLVDFSRDNIRKKDNDLLETGTVKLEVANGWDGLPSEGPFNVIHVGAAAETFPQKLMMQLAVGGIMICPVGPDGGVQYLYRVERTRDDHSEFSKDDYIVHNLLGVRYVPLVRK